MNTKTLRNRIFTLHRYIGLVIGLVAIIVGLTGSLLVFHTEIDRFDQQRRIPNITPLGDPVPLEVILDTVKQSYANQPDAKVLGVSAPDSPTRPIIVSLKTKEKDWLDNYVNPYTGAILGDNSQPGWVQKAFEVLYPLHYTLLAGDLGYKFVGMIGLLITVLAITGMILWPGWRKLIAGFKIKWDAHPKRLNFDIHKVAGVITAVFLVFTFLTGFFWAFGEFVNPLIYTVTFSQPAPEVASVPIANQAPLDVPTQIKNAQAALPNGVFQSISLPTEPKEVVWTSFKLPLEGEAYVVLDQFSGKVLQVDSPAQRSLGDRVLYSFTPLHYGTFWGLPSKIFYVFVGLAPLILFVTGFVMWQLRKPKQKPTQKDDLQLVERN